MHKDKGVNPSVSYQKSKSEYTHNIASKQTEQKLAKLTVKKKPQS